jgi:hypothetical protein
MDLKLHRFASGFAIVGAALLAFSLFTVAQVLVLALTTHRTMGAIDPPFTARAIAELFLTVFMSGIFALPALLLVAFTLVKLHYRAGWFLGFVCVASVFLLLLFPVGTGFAIFLFVHVLKRTRRFEHISHA